ncbi:MAG: virB8 family protein [Hyphomonadaceae bacterium]|jgi:type IV secretion system protein VirB8|uniref:virB8 family protein n=1 Tax=Aquidulcibacter sp. TaxID=2052990 RepID=UPI0022C57715|nr:type IV secretion system protein [Aquidulcibacter sp.]MCZ8207143.1 type IV secretion system protein [Aquidulcibacter sp.]
MTGPHADPSNNPAGVPPNGVAARAHYYEASSTWAQDTHATLRRSQRTAWIVAGIAVGIAAIQAVALVVLVPLKQTMPYTITVDRETGYVQTTRGVNLGTLSETEAVAQSFVVQYVLARETFDAADYREQYRKTLAWSQGAAETDYLRDWDKSNPNGIQSRVSPNTRIQVTVKSVTILGPRSAMIRFDTERSESGGGAGMRQPWVASVVYSFSGKPINEQDRYLNPLGFQISSYRRDAETTQPVPMPASPPPMIPAPTPVPTTGVTTLPVPGAPVTGAAPAMPAAQAPAQATPAAPPQSKSGNPNGEEFPAQ